MPNSNYLGKFFRTEVLEGMEHYQLRFVPPGNYAPMTLLHFPDDDRMPSDRFCAGESWETAVTQARVMMARFLASGYRLGADPRYSWIRGNSALWDALPNPYANPADPLDGRG
jgi:hypothetical protein